MTFTYLCRCPLKGRQQRNQPDIFASINLIERLNIEHNMQSNIGSFCSSSSIYSPPPSQNNNTKWYANVDGTYEPFFSTTTTQWTDSSQWFATDWELLKSSPLLFLFIYLKSLEQEKYDFSAATEEFYCRVKGVSLLPHTQPSRPTCNKRLVLQE